MQKSLMLISAAMLSIVMGCSSEETKQPPAVVEQGQPAPASGTGAATSPATGSAISGNPLTDPNNILSKRSIYYDFDSSLVSDQYKPLVTAHAQYLAANPSAKITIQGNCDERGSREYNIALGQRRADGVKKMMLLLGAADNQIDTISFGEEKPRAMGHNEEAWQQNRRSDIVYAGE